MPDSLGFLLHDAARLMRRRFDQRARALGVTRAQWQALFALQRVEGINQSTLADRLDLEPITLCRIVDRLEESGLVERRRDPADRRAWRLFLTEAALPILAQLHLVGAEVRREATDGLDAPALDALSAALLVIRANLAGRPADAGKAAL